MDHLSTEYVQIPIGAASDPIGYPVRIALLPVDGLSLASEPRPEAGDWHTATWTTIAGVPHVEILVGPDGGDVTLTAGLWRPWIDIDAGTEHPIIPAPCMRIT